MNTYQPTPEEIKKFLDIVSKLDNFEAEHRMIRGWGILSDETLPIPEVVTVMNWLKGLIGE